MTALLKLVVGNRWVFIALAVVIASLSGAAWLQTTRLHAAQQTVTAQGKTIHTLEDRVRDDSTAIAQRDALIAKQNAAVKAIVEQQAEERTAYLSRLAQADKRAETLQAKSADIMKRNVATTDELERARAALALIVEVVGKES